MERAMQDHADLPTPVAAGGLVGWSVSGYAMNGYASLAKWAGVSVERVIALARNDALAPLVELRSRQRRKPLNPRKPGMGARSPFDCYSVLAHKRHAPH